MDVEIQRQQKLKHADEKSKPSVFAFLDHKDYLRAFYEYKKATDAKFSFGVFARRARLQTRNYLKRIIDGERPITSELLPRISEALGFQGQEALYFDNLVRFSQTKDPNSKRYYLQQLRSASTGIKTSAAELVSQQFEVLSDWYFIPLWEYCEIAGADQSPEKVSRLFRGRITPAQVKKAFEKLVSVGLLELDEASGLYKKTHKIVNYHQDTVNLAIRSFHKQMLELTKTAIDEDSLDERYLRALSVAVNSGEVADVRKRIDEFFKELNGLYSESEKQKEIILQINIQALNLSKREK